MSQDGWTDGHNGDRMLPQNFSGWGSIVRYYLIWWARYDSGSAVMNQIY